MKKIKIKNTVFIERTKNFYVKKGAEKRQDMIMAIKNRESLGDKL